MRRFAALLLLLAPWPAWSAPTGDALAHLTGQPVLRGAAPTPAELSGRVVAVVFFASWCPPCHAEFRHLNAVARDYGPRGLSIIAVNVFEDFGGLSSPAQLAVFLDRYDPAFPVLSGDEAVKRNFDDLDRIPSLFVFGRDGRLAYHFRHARGAEKTHVDEAELRAVIEPLL